MSEMNLNDKTTLLREGGAPRSKWSRRIAWATIFLTTLIVIGIVVLFALKKQHQKRTPLGKGVRWVYETGDVVTSFPCFENGMVYFTSWDGDTYALDAITGGLRWRTPTGPAFPTVKDGTLFLLSTRFYLFAYNANTGALKWDFSTDSFAISPTHQPLVSNGMVYFGSNDHPTVYALNATSGKPIWTFKDTTSNDTQWNSPIEADGIVYIASLSRLIALNSKTGTFIWDYPCQSNVMDYYSTSHPVVVDGIVYIATFGHGNRSVFALKAKSGELLWHSDAIEWGSLVSPAVSQGLVFVSATIWNMTYALSAASGEIVKEYITDGYPMTTPLIERGTMYVGMANGELAAYDESDASVRWKLHFGGAIHSSPILVGDIMYFGCNDHKIYALEINRV